MEATASDDSTSRSVTAVRYAHGTDSVGAFSPQALRGRSRCDLSPREPARPRREVDPGTLGSGVSSCYPEDLPAGTHHPGSRRPWRPPGSVRRTDDRSGEAGSWPVSFLRPNVRQPTEKLGQH